MFSHPHGETPFLIQFLPEWILPMMKAVIYKHLLNACYSLGALWMVCEEGASSCTQIFCSILSNSFVTFAHLIKQQLHAVNKSIDQKLGELGETLVNAVFHKGRNHGRVA
jgi:hypothetical protein